MCCVLQVAMKTGCWLLIVVIGVTGTTNVSGVFSGKCCIQVTLLSQSRR